MAAIYEIFRDKDGHFRFWLVAGNGRLLLTSKSYETRHACANAIASAKKNASAINRFKRRKADNGKSYFILKAGNNRTLGQSGLFASNDSLDGAIEIVRKHGPQSPVNDLTMSVH